MDYDTTNTDYGKIRSMLLYFVESILHLKQKQVDRLWTNQERNMQQDP